MKFLVVGGTGNLGSNVVRELLSRQHHVRVLTRNPDKAKVLGPSVDVVKGDLLDVATFTKLYDGVDGVFFLNPAGQTEAQEGLMVVSSARTAKVKRIVHLSLQHADRGGHIPHFGAKAGVETGVKASGIAWTILRPSNFYQNDYFLKDAILKVGVYPQPIGDLGISRVDMRDIAELAAITLTQAGHEGKTYDVVGPRPLTGAQTAEIWSTALGRKINYAGNDLDAWGNQMSPFLPPYLIYGFKLMYAAIQKDGLLRGTDQDVETMTRLLKHAPRKFEDFAAETAKQWTREGATASR